LCGRDSIGVHPDKGAGWWKGAGEIRANPSGTGDKPLGATGGRGRPPVPGRLESAHPGRRAAAGGPAVARGNAGRRRDPVPARAAIGRVAGKTVPPLNWSSTTTSPVTSSILTWQPSWAAFPGARHAR
jgi:hypothetical protein